jgi:hypothetical protein
LFIKSHQYRLDTDSWTSRRFRRQVGTWLAFRFPHIGHVEDPTVKPKPPIPLLREILVALAVKLALLLGIWIAFFSGTAPDAADPAQVSRAILERPTVPAHPMQKE